MKKLAALALLAGCSATTTGARAQEDVGRLLQEELRAHGGDVYGCWGQALDARQGAAGGEVLVRIHVAPGGAVERAEILEDRVGSPVLADCLTGKLRAWRVPRLAAKETQQFVFPLAFQPEPVKAAPAPKPSDPGSVVSLADGKPGAMPGGRIDARVLVGPGTPVSLTRLTLRPSTRLALHAHPGALELIYIVRGLARLRDGSGRLENVENGDLIVAPAGSPHNIEAAPLAALEVIQVFAPAGPEHAYLDPGDRGGTVTATKQKGPPPDPAASPQVVRASGRKEHAIAGGKGQALLFLDGGPVKDVSLQRLEMTAGAAVPTHQHDTSDEIIYVLSGKGEMELGGKTFSVGAGDGIRIPKGTPHALRVTEKMEAVQCYAPAGPEQRFKGAAAK